MFSIMLGISLPINYGGNKTAKVNETKSTQQLFRQEYESNLQLVRISIETSLAKLNSIYERERIVNKGLLNLAAQTFKAALASYQVGQVEFLNVIDAVANQLEFETDLYRLRTEYYKELSNLEFVIGTDPNVQGIR